MPDTKLSTLKTATPIGGVVNLASYKPTVTIDGKTYLASGYILKSDSAPAVPSDFVWGMPQTFTAVTTLSGQIRSIESDKKGVVMACTSNGTLHVSTDYGATWSADKTSFNQTGYDIETDEKGLWVAACASGYILKSTDNGNTWSQAWRNAAASPPALFSIATNGKGFWIAVGQAGNYSYSVDNAVTWVDGVNGTTDLNSVVIDPNSNLGAICGASGRLLSFPITSSGADVTLGTISSLSATERGTSGTTSYTTICFYDGKFVTELSGTIYYSTNGGASYAAVTLTGQSQTLYSAASENGVLFLGISAGDYRLCFDFPNFVTRYDGTSSNGNGLASTILYAAEAPGDGCFLVGGANGIIYRSTDKYVGLRTAVQGTYMRIA